MDPHLSCRMAVPILTELPQQRSGAARAVPKAEHLCCISAQPRVSRHHLEAGWLPRAQREAGKVGISSAWPTAGKGRLGEGAPAPLPKKFGFGLYEVTGNLLTPLLRVTQHCTGSTRNILKPSCFLAGGFNFAHLVLSGNSCHRTQTPPYGLRRVVLRGNTLWPSPK